MSKKRHAVEEDVAPLAKKAAVEQQQVSISLDSLLNSADLAAAAQRNFSYTQRGKSSAYTISTMETPAASDAATAISQYQDVMVTTRTPESGKKLRTAYMRHVLTHVMQHRAQVVKNDKLMKQAEISGKPLEQEVRDQGFSRPTVLILVPFRSTAKMVVDTLIALVGGKDANVKSYDRFKQDYSTDQPPPPEFRPADFLEIFSGHSDDTFRFGISFSKQRVKLFSQFYKSDIIIGSPLGLKLVVGAAGDEERDYDFLSSIEVVICDQANVQCMQNWDHVDTLFELLNLTPTQNRGTDFSRVRELYLNGQAKYIRQTVFLSAGDEERDYDFLSSIEVVICDQANVQCMQNWDHVDTLFELLNLTPTQNRGTDFSRVRELYLNGQAKYIRQTVFLSAHSFPEMNALFHRRCFNVRGAHKFMTEYSGSIRLVAKKVRQLFHHVPCSNYTSASDDRFAFFVETLLPQLRASVSKHYCVFIPSYLDYVRVRNYCKTEEMDVSFCCEYTKDEAMQTARRLFRKGQNKYMLITERLHFYQRARVRGIHHLVFYQLPRHEQFYSEIVNMLDGTDVDVCAMFTSFDALELERVVGTQRAQRMLTDTKPTYLFC
eukprot:TRINITY_DN12498_c0_g1_i1.p1 TRINITY_DN12498_c0_g1~~TRINITY_DN12498_c0_g1_i1.p1  ORF type:complete len:604 (+),score=124.22 TRINITY_DN12498_c0_g1_i1:25-1836(+)